MSILAIDQGTTSSRAIFFDRDCQVIGSAQQETTQIYPHPGHVHQSPEEIWRTTRQTITDALAQSKTDWQKTECIGITNQRETTIVWDRQTGAPLTPAIVWQSRESEPWVSALRQRGREETYRHITGLTPDAYFSATKLAMLLDQTPDLRAKAEAGEVLFGTVDAWILWNLTGGTVHATDLTNASRTMLFDIRSLDWSETLLSDLGIPRAMLPEVRPSSGFFGETSPHIFGAAVPVTGIAGDQHAALFGQACFAPGDVKSTYGTGAFMLMNTGPDPIVSMNGLLTTIAWGVESAPTYALEGSVFIAGAAVQWLRDGLGIISSSRDIEPLAASVQSSEGVVFVPALVGLGAPYWDSGARGTIIGLTRGSTGAHIARATLDAIACQVTDVVTAMQKDSSQPLTAMRIDGGAAANDLLAQIQADLIGIPVVRPQQLETTAMGAAFLAGLAAGVWVDQDAIAATWREEARFEPVISAAERSARLDRWHQAVERARGWV